MDVFLWVIQILLVAIILTFGLIKVVVSLEKLKIAMPWSENLSPLRIRAIGSIESICALGLFFPGLYPINPSVIPISASILAIIMISAIVFHIRRNEKKDIVLPVFNFLLAIFVAVGRFILQ